MRVHIPSPLRSYTRGASLADVPGRTLGEIARSLDERYPGLRFRIVDEQDCVRAHIKFFVNTRHIDELSCPVQEGDEVTIVCALSGG